MTELAMEQERKYAVRTPLSQKDARTLCSARVTACQSHMNDCIAGHIVDAPIGRFIGIAGESG